MRYNAISKINKLGKIGYVICTILKICLIFWIVLSIVEFMILPSIPGESLHVTTRTEHSAILYMDEDAAEKLLSLLGVNVKDGVVKVDGTMYALITEESGEPFVTEGEYYPGNMKWSIAGSLILFVAEYIVFRFAGKVCKNFRDCETPFTEEVSRSLTHLAWSMIPVWAYKNLIFKEAMNDFILTGHGDFSLTLDLPTVFMILCILMLSYVFKYGTVLQIESDEIL